VLELQIRTGVASARSAKPLLTLSKYLLDPLPLSDVLGDSGDPPDAIRLILDRKAPVPDPTDRLIGRMIRYSTAVASPFFCF